MSDPIVSNVRMTGQALPEPREGLPPCVSAVVFGDRQAVLRDSSLCETFHDGKQFWVTVGTTGKPRSKSATHPETVGLLRVTGGFTVETDDPAEAQAAFERGAEWVRTGEMA